LPPEQHDLFRLDAARSLLDHLIAQSRLYTQSRDYLALLEFVARLRNFAPFNAMLLQVQRPGLRFAASAFDWQQRFERTPKEGARPLLILWPFGPVALVYDAADTEGKPLPADAAAFFAHGPIDAKRMAGFVPRAKKHNIDWRWTDAGDAAAGAIRVVRTSSKAPARYRLEINPNHPPPVQFATLAHELAHLFLGHLGDDSALNVPPRPRMAKAQRELEAESVAYLVCARNGVASKSESYLKDYVSEHTSIGDIDIYQVMRAAGQIEALLGLSVNTKYAHGKGKAARAAEQAQGLLF
jgi:IrrE N-terminal-like domain